MDQARRVLLVGMMGAGKSTVGRLLAKRSGWPYLDNDELLALSAGQSTPDLLATGGETALREAETAALDVVLATDPPLIASVAAGTVLDAANRARMRERAFIVYLRGPVSVLAARVAAGPARPWLVGDVEPALARLAAGREPLYEEVADLVLDVDGATPTELANRILRALAKAPGRERS